LPFSGDSGEVTLSDAIGEVPDFTKVFVWDSGYIDFTYLSALGGWVDSSLNHANGFIVSQGTALWVKADGGATQFIHSGEVPTLSSYTIDFTAGFTLISPPYPVDLPLSDIDITDIQDFDKIFVWTESGYIDYTYLTPLGGWVDSDLAPAGGETIPAGTGVWLSASGSGSITFTKPY
jgi:hypothetical protein